MKDEWFMYGQYNDVVILKKTDVVFVLSDINPCDLVCVNVIANQT
jgi:hypothetical protein